jgi:tRNA (cytidine/uridine-2'-O-)-methyltransferase
MEIVLVHPEIPPNTGSVARVAAATGVRLHLVEPLGFSLDSRHLKRAGLDYWPDVDMLVHEDWQSLLRELEPGSDRPALERMHFFTARGGTSLFDGAFAHDDVLVFGCESTGLPADLLATHAERKMCVPVRSSVRSLNLANVVCLAVYTALERVGGMLPDKVEVE